MDAIFDAFRFMGLASWLAAGLLAGVAARFLLPGRDAAGCVVSGLVGLAGAVLGGVLATYLGFGGLSGFDRRAFVVAILGAILLLMLLRVLRRPRDAS